MTGDRSYREIDVVTDVYDPSGDGGSHRIEQLYLDEETGIVVGDKAKFEPWLASLTLGTIPTTLTEQDPTA